MEANALLIVEDNEDDLFIMNRALDEAGVRNPRHVAEDGQMAIDYLSGSGQFADRFLFPLPKLVLLDLKLPEKSGFEVLTWMRNEPALIGIVVVVLTSSEEPRDINTAYRLGANSYLVKPPTADELIQMAKSFKWYWLEYNHFKVENC
jgi:CheY-like chemotaxis protein